MTISTYASLQTAIDNWLANTLFTARYPEFIQLFESVANRRLRTPYQEALATLTPASDGTVALPSDYLAHRRCTWTGSARRELEYVHPSYFQASYPTRPADIPAFFTIEDSTLKVIPLNTTPVELEYFQKIPALATLAPTDGTQHNWLLDSHPDLYLFGALVEASMYAVDDDRGVLWKSRRDEIFDELDKLGQKRRAPAAIRVMSFTP